MSKRTYIDSSVLIAISRGSPAIKHRALAILDDPNRTLVVSEVVRLETLPKAVYNKRLQEAEFYNSILRSERTEYLDWDIEVLKQAYQIAEKHGLSALDAIHIAYAIQAEVDEFITCERSTSPLFRIQEIPVRSLSDELSSE